jgi:hypothetical protein
MAIDVAVVAGTLPGHGGNYHIDPAVVWKSPPNG